ncbi:MAG: hypothetical protein JKY03_02150 [Aureispira sp.]|nr:hypothetical protein [Aureispira sp.]
MQLTKEEIQKIITYEVIVDCYDDDEANIGWAIFLSENINYPFEAKYQVKKKNGSNFWKKVTVIDHETDESNFEGTAFYVEIELDDFIIPVEILQLKNIKADKETLRTIQV